MSIVEELGLTPAEIREEYRDILGDHFIPEKRANADGWVDCWALGRPKGNNPNGGFNEQTAWYTDLGQKHGTKEPMSLVDVKIRHGGCADAKEAIVCLRARWRPETLTGFPKSKAEKVGGTNLVPPEDPVRSDRRATSPLEFLTSKGELDPGHAGGFLASKPGTSYEGILKVGFRPSDYPRGGEDRKSCLYAKAFDSRLDFDNPQAVVLVRRDGKKFEPATGSTEERSCIVRKGAGQKTSGMLGEHGLRMIAEGRAKLVWKVEGVSDAIALQGIIPRHLIDEVAVITSACGATENATPKEFVSRLAGLPVVLVGDCDIAGQTGVEKWTEWLAEAGNTNASAVPPWLPVAPRKGEDLRDLIVSGKTYDDLLAMAQPVMPKAPKPEKSKQPAGPRKTLRITRLSDAEPEKMQWEWPGVLPKGKFTLAVGDPGLSKSLCANDIAARFTNGSCWPCGTPIEQPGTVIMMNSEDDLRDTILPRFIAAGGDRSRAIFIESTHTEDAAKGKTSERMFHLQEDLDALEEAIRDIDGPKLVEIDPVSNYMKGADTHKDAEVRAVLMPFVELLRKTGTTAIGVCHLNKSSAANAIHRIGGSIGFVGVARSVWAVARDPDDPQSARRLFLPVKANLASDVGGYAYSIKSTMDKVPYLSWEAEPITGNPTEILSPNAATNGTRNRSSPAVDDAADWLSDRLADGPVPSKDVFEDGKAHGHTVRTIKRAMGTLDVQTGKKGFQGQWQMYLPGKECQPDTMPI